MYSAKTMLVWLLPLIAVSAIRAQDSPSRSPRQPVSGLAVGAEVAAWNPIHYSGPDAGTNHCPVCTYLDKPVVLVFARQTLNTVALVRQLESLATTNANAGLKCFVILIDGTPNTAKELAEQYRLRNVGVCLLDQKTRTADLKTYNIDARFENTVLYYRNYVVEANRINFQSLDMGQLQAEIAKSLTPVAASRRGANNSR